MSSCKAVWPVSAFLMCASCASGSRVDERSEPLLLPAESMNVVTLAGVGNGDGLTATAALLNGPRGIAFDGGGNLFICDTGSNRIRRVAAAGTIISTLGH